MAETSRILLAARSHFRTRSTAFKDDWRRLFALLLLALTSAAKPALAQVDTSYEEQHQLIRAPRAITSLDEGLFGDTVNMYNGRLDFVQTDVSLPGNNRLPVSIGRRVTAGENPLDGRPFGRWELDIPHIHGMFAANDGWKDPDGGVLRCSNFGPPPLAFGTNGTSYWDAHEFWQGSFIYVPGAGDQRMLSRDSRNSASPGQVQNYPVVTAKFWSIACLPSLSNASSSNTGEGFLAVAPDGTKYYFDWLVRLTATTMRKSDPDPAYASATAPSLDSGTITATSSFAQLSPDLISTPSLQRKEIWLLPTKVVDRFGNTVTYTYDPLKPQNLSRIDSSDGRSLSLSYGLDSRGVYDVIRSVSDGSRTWTYAYHTSASGNMSSLDRVTLPDNSAWNFAGFDNLLSAISFINNGGCDNPPSINSLQRTGSIVHPSGATVSFTLTPTIHGRSHVGRACNITASGESLVIPRFFASQSLTNKTISGPGISPLSWTFDYGPTNESWDTCTDCISTKTVSVTNPAQQVNRYTYGNWQNVTEGRLEKTEFGWDGTTAVKTVTNRYRPYGAGPYPDYAGVSDPVNGGDSDMENRLAPIDQHVTSLQGVTFTWQANEFDAFARPLSVTKSNSLGMSKSEQTRYADNIPRWILGQQESVTELNTQKVEVQNVFDSDTATLSSVSHFGHLDRTMTYYADGTLATRNDGNNHTTVFSNYARGIPQTINYADGSSEHVGVNNIGRITSLTDATGAITTFGYDAMGRLASVAYPAGDTVAWNATTLALSQVFSAEYGLDVGHWKQVVSTGTGRKVNYYDALLRPVYTEEWDDADRANTSRIVKHQYDFAGRTTFESLPKRTYNEIADGVSHEYDALGRPTLTATSSELGTLYDTFQYVGGFQKVYTDAKSNNTYYTYQTFDEPSESAIASISAPEGARVDIQRDVFGKPGSITRSGNGKSATRRYVYDAYERLCKTIEPETGATVQDYDAANNVSWRAAGLSLSSTTSCDTANVPATSKANYAYDAVNRLTSNTFGDGSPSITRSYTADGLLETISSNGAVWTNAYNKRRLNETESLAYGGATYRIGRSYDANGSLSQLTYPDNSAVSYAPNALGEPRAVGAYASAITYHPNGAVKSFTYGNGIVHTMSQNARGLPEWSEDVGILKDNYVYDKNGNVNTIADQREGISNRSMTYDGLNRLTRVNAPSMWGDAWYSYDALDNLTSVQLTAGGTVRTTTHSFDPATNRLVAISNGAGAGYNYGYQYDGQGNIVQRGTQSYTFDLANRMTSASGKATYAYDGLGHRFSMVGADGVNRINVYSQEGQLLYVKASNSAVGTTYVYLHRHVLAEVSGGSATYDHTDGLGSPVAQTNASGALLNRTRYEPYGAVAAGNAGTIGFTGHVNDNDTGLVYMQQRYYDPVAGRFLSIDPVVTDANTGGSFNRYVYASNSPYKYVDPDGRQERAAEAFSDQFRNDAASGNSGVYEPFHTPVVIATIGMVVGPPVAAAVIAGAPAEGAIAGGVGAKAAAQVAKAATPTEAQAKNIQRFTSKLPANAKESVTVKPLPNGGVAAQGVSPGKVPGSSALYEKQIDSAGKTIQYTKTTTAPDGAIVHVKDKITGNVVTP
jgi:RHS repeat-associated protein